VQERDDMNLNDEKDNSDDLNWNPFDNLTKNLSREYSLSYIERKGNFIPQAKGGDLLSFDDMLGGEG
jgi:hypothetical protein